MLPNYVQKAYTMSSPYSAPFSRAVVNAMRRLYPEALADKSFDNTGLLLEAPFAPTRRQKNSVLLTVDLTKAVADEAIARRDSIVIAYHPIIFRGLKRLTLADSQQDSLLRLAAEGISVYSPHTAIDAAPSGLGDWLADIVTGAPGDESEDSGAGQQDSFRENSSKRPTYMLQHHPSQLSVKELGLSLGAANHTRKPITPCTVAGYENTGAGMGRIVRFSSPQPLLDIVDRISLGLGNPKGFPIAVPQGRSAHDMQISSVAICAGSGGGLFGAMNEHVDLLFTGELSHHEALAAIERGQCVITLFHSNTERGFLHSVLKAQLEGEVQIEVGRGSILPNLVLLTICS